MSSEVSHMQVGTHHVVRRAVRPGSESGQVLVLWAFALVAFCGLIGMTVDIGQVVWRKTDMQKAADAAALAASQDLNGTASGASTAIATADAWLVKNGYASASCRPNCASVPSPYDTITVDLSTTVSYFFLPVVGVNSGTPSVSARAMGTPGAVATGYAWSSPSVAPFTIWGGSRQTEVNPGDHSCALHVCIGKSYTFLDTGWMAASGEPTAPDWTASGSNNFKGDVDHGAGAPVNNVGDFVSGGGLGSVTAPSDGEILVIPIVDKASGGSNARTFHIAAWAVVRVDTGCRKQHCSGTVLDPSTTTPPDGFVTTGSVQPPSSLAYKSPPVGKLID